jgi:hypothetical protein
VSGTDLDFIGAPKGFEPLTRKFVVSYLVAPLVAALLIRPFNLCATTAKSRMLAERFFHKSKSAALMVSSSLDCEPQVMGDDHAGNKIHRGRRYQTRMVDGRAGTKWRSAEGRIHSAKPDPPGFRKKSAMSRAGRPASIPNGAWPRRMRADLAAGYCGEKTIEAFLRRVGRDYPLPRVKEGRRQLWLIDDLDRAIVPTAYPADAAEDL